MLYWEMEGKQGLIGLTDVVMRSEREKGREGETERQITRLDVFVFLSHL